MKSVDFVTVAKMPGVDLTPTEVEGRRAFVLRAADELYAWPGAAPQRVRTGIALPDAAAVLLEFAPLPLSVEPAFAAAREVVQPGGAAELCPLVSAAPAGGGVVLIEPGDPVAMLLVHFAPTIHLAERAADAVQPAFRDDGQPASTGVA